MSEHYTIHAAKMFDGEVSEGALRVMVVGVGGAGTNAVDAMKLDDLGDVRLAAVNTDAQALAGSPLPEKLMIGRSVTRGLSAGGEPELARKAAEGDREKIMTLLRGTDLVFLVAGLGGGTGSGSTPVVAEVAAECGALVIAFVSLPFTLEGKRRQEQAAKALSELRRHCSAVIALPNDLLLQQVEDQSTLLEAFERADAWIGRGVRSIAAMLFRTGLINVDFKTLRHVFREKSGRTLFGLGRGVGAGAARQALEDLMLCPLLHSPESASKADNLLVNIVCGTGLSMNEVNEVLSELTVRFNSRENTVLGAVVDEQMGESVEICVIGTTDMSQGRVVPPPVRRAEPGAAKTPAAGAAGTSDKAQAETAGGPARAPEPVHASKLPATVAPADQEEFAFVSPEEQRGFFDLSERNMFDGQDLDVPTFLRQGVKIQL